MCAGVFARQVLLARFMGVGKCLFKWWYGRVRGVNALVTRCVCVCVCSGRLSTPVCVCVCGVCGGGERACSVRVCASVQSASVCVCLLMPCLLCYGLAIQHARTRRCAVYMPSLTQKWKCRAQKCVRRARPNSMRLGGSSFRRASNQTIRFEAGYNVPEGGCGKGRVGRRGGRPAGRLAAAVGVERRR